MDGYITRVVQSSGGCDKAIQRKGGPVLSWVAGEQGAKGSKGHPMLEMKLPRQIGFLPWRWRGSWHRTPDRKECEQTTERASAHPRDAKGLGIAGGREARGPGAQMDTEVKGRPRCVTCVDEFLSRGILGVPVEKQKRHLCSEFAALLSALQSVSRVQEHQQEILPSRQTTRRAAVCGEVQAGVRRRGGQGGGK